MFGHREYVNGSVYAYTEVKINHKKLSIESCWPPIKPTNPKESKKYDRAKCENGVNCFIILRINFFYGRTYGVLKHPIDVSSAIAIN